MSSGNAYYWLFIGSITSFFIPHNQILPSANLLKSLTKLLVNQTKHMKSYKLFNVEPYVLCFYILIINLTFTF